MNQEQLLTRLGALEVVNGENERDAKGVLRKCQRVRDEINAVRATLTGTLEEQERERDEEEAQRVWEESHELNERRQ